MPSKNSQQNKNMQLYRDAVRRIPDLTWIEFMTNPQKWVKKAKQTNANGKDTNNCNDGTSTMNSEPFEPIILTRQQKIQQELEDLISLDSANGDDHDLVLLSKLIDFINKIYHKMQNGEWHDCPKCKSKNVKCIQTGGKIGMQKIVKLWCIDCNYILDQTVSSPSVEQKNSIINTTNSNSNYKSSRRSSAAIRWSLLSSLESNNGDKINRKAKAVGINVLGKATFYEMSEAIANAHIELKKETCKKIIDTVKSTNPKDHKGRTIVNISTDMGYFTRRNSQAGHQEIMTNVNGQRKIIHSETIHKNEFENPDEISSKCLEKIAFDQASAKMIKNNIVWGIVSSDDDSQYNTSISEYNQKNDANARKGSDEWHTLKNKYKMVQVDAKYGRKIWDMTKHDYKRKNYTQKRHKQTITYWKVMSKIQINEKREIYKSNKEKYSDASELKALATETQNGLVFIVKHIWVHGKSKITCFATFFVRT